MIEETPHYRVANALKKHQKNCLREFVKLNLPKIPKGRLSKIVKTVL